MMSVQRCAWHVSRVEGGVRVECLWGTCREEFHLEVRFLGGG
jgi:hypothetical protein